MQAVKPLNDFSQLDKYLSSSAVKQTIPPLTKLIYAADEPKIIVFSQGIVKIERSKEDLLVGMCSAPMILGLPGLFSPSRERHQFTALTSCQMYQLEIRKCKEVLDKHKLWPYAFNWLSWQYRMQELRDVQLIGKGSYSQIRATLQSMAQWDETLLGRIGVMSYIQQRTRISRSVIAEVLAALREGKYIEMEKGKLLSINRLPLEY
ncbi:transcriptional regulator [Enterobacteriaceae bacterium 89]|nr:transcriptional regulator [Enterobacteriaceae bacterium 89]